MRCLLRNVKDLGFRRRIGRIGRIGTEETQEAFKAIGSEPVSRHCLDASPPNPPTAMRHLYYPFTRGDPAGSPSLKTYAMTR